MKTKRPKLVTQTPVKTEAEIMQEYANTCAQLGEKQYEVRVISEAIENLMITIRNLNLEMHDLKKHKALKAEKEAKNV